MNQTSGEVPKSALPEVLIWACLVYIAVMHYGV